MPYRQFSAHQQIHSTTHAYSQLGSISQNPTRWAMDIGILQGWYNNIILEGRRYHQDMESAGVYVSSCTTWIIMFRLPKLSILVLIYNQLAESTLTSCLQSISEILSYHIPLFLQEDPTKRNTQA